MTTPAPPSSTASQMNRNVVQEARDESERSVIHCEYNILRGGGQRLLELGEM